jgi:hypothetical protein
MHIGMDYLATRGIQRETSLTQNNKALTLQCSALRLPGETAVIRRPSTLQRTRFWL